MTLPAARFAAIAPAPDGLSLAFTAARRRRNSRAGTAALGGAVAIVSALSFLAPPGQTLVQQPVPPARGGLVPGLSVPPQEPTLPSPLIAPGRTAAAGAPSVLLGVATRRDVAPVRAGLRDRASAPRVSAPTACGEGGWVDCRVVRLRTTAGGNQAQAAVCASGVSVTVEYAGPVVAPTTGDGSRHIEVGTHGCAAS
jgi:hypothetical protein